MWSVTAWALLNCGLHGVLPRFARLAPQAQMQYRDRRSNYSVTFLRPSYAALEATHGGCRIIGSRQDVILLAYPNLLRRTIDNVLRNAIRYSPSGMEIELDCKIDLVERELVVEILDRGPGVPEAALADIFRPFFRTAPGREASSGGSGLGLAIANEAVRFHDGRIEACNRKGGGLR